MYLTFECDQKGKPLELTGREVYKLADLALIINHRAKATVLMRKAVKFQTALVPSFFPALAA